MSYMEMIKNDPANFQKWRMSLHFMEESILLEKAIDTTGGVSLHEVSPIDIERSFAPKVQFSTGLILPGTIYYGKSSKEEKCVIVVRKQRREIRIKMAGKQTLTLNVPMPNMVFWGVGRKYSMAAIKDDTPTADSKLYNAPVPNVHAGSNSICQGNSKFPACSISNIRKAETMFWESYFNEDLSNDKSKSYKGSVIDLLKNIKDSKTFPVSELVSGNRDTTISDLITTMEGDSHADD